MHGDEKRRLRHAADGTTYHTNVARPVHVLRTSYPCLMLTRVLNGSQLYRNSRHARYLISVSTDHTAASAGRIGLLVFERRMRYASDGTTYRKNVARPVHKLQVSRPRLMPTRILNGLQSYRNPQHPRHLVSVSRCQAAASTGRRRLPILILTVL